MSNITYLTNNLLEKFPSQAEKACTDSKPAAEIVLYRGPPY